MAKLILFQGDSITDAGRSRDSDFFPGHGYPTMLTGELGYLQPGKYRFLNRAISGNRVVDLYARIKADFINLNPDIVSILIGINDVWHEMGNRNGVDAEKFERVYGWLLTEIRAALPECRFMILEPFVIPGSATVDAPEAPDRWKTFRTEVDLRAAAAKRVAEKHSAVFVPLQERFNEVCRTSDPALWAIDGVHPTAMGHELIARALTAAFYAAE